MKKLLVVLIICIPFFVYGQEEGYTMYQTINIVPDNKNIDKLSAALKEHNSKFHAEGDKTAFVWSISSGPRIGQLIWMRGPLKFEDLDTPLSKEHDEHWSGDVMPYVKKIETLEYWKRDDDWSNVVGDPRSKLFVSMFKIAKGQGYQLNDYFTKINETVKALDGENPWAVWHNLFRQGDMGRHIAAVSQFNDWAWIDVDDKFREKFQEIHGQNSWTPFMRMQDQLFEDMYDEIWVLAPELSGNQ